MTKPSHTPGPWKAQPAGYPTRQWDIVADSGRRNVAETICDHEANARLIAAAPELLAACEGVLGVLNHGTPTKEDGTPNTHWKHIDIIRAAIAKATGEEI
jgi:hypothetical protein